VRTLPTRDTAIWSEDILRGVERERERERERAKERGGVYSHCRIGPADEGTATICTYAQLARKDYSKSSEPKTPIN